MHIQLMADGAADIPEHAMEMLDVKMVPLYVYIQGEEYKTGVTIDTETFYQKMEDSEELPKSSAPSPVDFYEAYKQIDGGVPIIMLSLSQNLSATYDNAITAKNMLLKEEPDREIEVINSKTASVGIAVLLHAAKQQIEQGRSFQEVVTHIHEQIKKTNTLFVLKTLENLILGGRLDRVRGTVAKYLNTKLLMHGSEEGTIEVTEKVRGNKKSIRRFVQQIGEHVQTFENKVIMMSHCNAEERARTVLADIQEKYAFKAAYLTEMGPLSSTYAGKGGLVISFFKD